MGKFIKKASAIILSAAGIFLAAPSAFCFPPKVGNEKGDNCVPCFNFRVINPEEKLNFCLPREVYLAENRKYGRFVATFPKGIKRMVYFPHRPLSRRQPPGWWDPSSRSASLRRILQ